MISSSPLTRTAPTWSPLRSEVRIDITPMPPRPLTGNCSTGVRLPKPFSVTVITSPSSPMISEITRWPLPSLTPRTPQAVRPIARTSDSRKRIALPAEVNSMMPWLPSVMSTPINWSSSRRSTAMIPLVRGREKSTSGVFFTVPEAVAMNTKRSSA